MDYRVTSASATALLTVCCLAEIVRRFDVCAIQGTRTDLTAMLTLLLASARRGA